MTTTIDVALHANPYRIHIESGLLRCAGDMIRAVAPSHRAALIVDSAIAQSHAPIVRDSLRTAGFETVEVAVAADETSKSLEQTKLIYSALLRATLDRASPIIALGGGVIGDLAGFVAATYLRGVPFIQIPTTLLAMVDASIGGKTGVNFPLPGSDQLGKNLIGAFWQPRAVLIDPHVLSTLPPRHFRCGLAESIKHAILADRSLFEWIATNAPAILAMQATTLAQFIERSARIKVNIVVEDERETGRRALLNLGHTFGHVIETISELELHHGEAVAIGLVAAANVAVATGRLNPADARRISALLQSFGLPVRLSQPLAADRLLSLMQFDKKTSHGRLRFILPLGIGSAEIRSDIPPNLVLDAWRAVGAS